VKRIALGWAVALALLILLLSGARAGAQPTLPALTGRVVDQANVLSPSAEEQMASKLAELEARTSRQLVVVTIPSLQGLEIEDFGYKLGRAWGIGQQGDDNGALLIVAPNERRVRVEVGYGLEPVLTDALSNVILQKRVLPRFRDGDLQGGIIDGVDALIEQLTLPDDEAKRRVADAAPGAGEMVAIPAALLAMLAMWVIVGVIGSLWARPGHRADAWVWPLILLMRSAGGFGGRGGGFKGRGGSFGGGGASGRW
jgi:uncharacterized protein